MSAPASQFTVLAIMVRDVEAATRFYREAFGFVEGATTRPQGGAAGVTARFIQKDHTVIELVQLEAVVAPNLSEQPLSQTGTVSHIVFSVVDMRATEDAVVKAGGTVLEASRAAVTLADVGPVEIVYARDPDGLWIELCKIDEEARKRYSGLPEP